MTGTVGADVLNYNGTSAGPIQFNGISGADTLNIQGGSYVFNADASLAAPQLAIHIFVGSAIFNSTQHLAQLTIYNGASAILAASGATSYLQVAGLSLGPSAKLDLNDNHLIVTYTGTSPFSTIQSLVKSGYSATPDASRTGIVSTTGQNTHYTMLALLDNAIAGETEWPLGSGNTIPANAVIGLYTCFGDATFDGSVTADDYLVLDANRDTQPDPRIAWMHGDMTGDGSVTADDYLVLDARRGQTAWTATVMAPSSLAAFSATSLKRNDVLDFNDINPIA